MPFTQDQLCKIAHSLDDQEFEYILRYRLRQELATLESLTEGPSGYNHISLTFTSEGGKWSVTSGKTYGKTQNLSGEVLGGIVQTLVMTQHELAARATLIALPGPRPEGALVTSDQSDQSDELPF